MIAGLSKAVTLYLATLLALTALFLTYFAFLAPVLLLEDRVALLLVTPSTSLQDDSASNSKVDGPTLRIGSLGSCSRSSRDADFSCTDASLSPSYDLSVLPSNAPLLLTAPPSASSAFIAVSLAFSSIFVLLFTLISLRSKLGPKLGPALDKPFLNRAVAWLGLLGFMIGLTAFLVVRMWFEKAISDFNAGVKSLGTDGPALIASAGQLSSTMVKQSVFVVGATGRTGSVIVDALLKSDKFHVTAGARPSSVSKPEYKSLESRGVEIRPIDIDNWTVEQLTSTLRGVDTVISAFSPSSLAIQKVLADANKAAGVKRFIPNDWATACVRGFREFHDQKLGIHDYVKEIGLGYSFIDVGWWMELALPILDPSKAYVPELVDIARIRYGSGNVKNALTDRNDIGKFVARIITDERTLNRYVFAWTEERTQNEVFEIAERVSGHKFDIISMPAEETAKRAKEATEFIKKHSYQYMYSIWVRGDNTVKNAKKEEYGGALDARELYPDIGQELKSLEQFAKEFYGVSDQ